VGRQLVAAVGDKEHSTYSNSFSIAYDLDLAAGRLFLFFRLEYETFVCALCCGLFWWIVCGGIARG
jgi:hypothetical protein